MDVWTKSLNVTFCLKSLNQAENPTVRAKISLRKIQLNLFQVKNQLKKNIIESLRIKEEQDVSLLEALKFIMSGCAKQTVFTRYFISAGLL